MSDTNRWLTVREAAAYMRKGEAAMRAHANATDDTFIPSSPDGRRIIFDRNDLDAYLENRKTS